ncbi:hypothetical protein B0H14DRAFT_3441890 [Mycena olivaceomarginata]|nr:hypothetical protein B0H14DRAFT_3441890 [Mycena olivaceomarginata]
MDVDGLEGLQHLQGLAEDEDFDPNNSNTPNMVNMGGVLNGSEQRLKIGGRAVINKPPSEGLYVRHGTRRETPVQEVYEIRVVDMFETSTVEVKLKPTENGIAPALVREGLFPCAPWEPSVAIPVRVLEAYSIQHVAYRPFLCQQFSIAYDLYLDIRRRVDERVMLLLGRDSKWRMKHACPACMYKLEGEDKLIFDMLTTMDGNDSLKRVLRRSKTSMGG